MRKNLKTDETEPKNSNHGQNEQHRIEGEGGKGVVEPTRKRRGKKAESTGKSS